MAHYSVHVSTVRRGIGQNAVASGAYISRSKLSLTVTDKETNIKVSFNWDYSKKGGLAYSKIHAPKGAPGWIYNREVLWNKAEDAENRCDSETAGKIMIALPNEFSEEQNISLAENIARELVAMGMVVDTNIHNDHENNPHLHIQHTQRELVKNRYGEIEFSGLKNLTWRGPKWVRYIREMAAEKINHHYLANGYDLQVSHKSYKDLGIDLEPGVHEGPARNIKNSELVELNNKIAAANAEKIKAKPSIILDVLGMNSPIFTKEQIATELDKRLNAGIDFTKVEDVERLQKELSKTFTELYEQILACPELSLVTEADLKGRTLYTTTKRLELEKRFTQNVEALHRGNRHGLNLKDSDLDYQSLSEKIGAYVRDVTTDVVELVNEHTPIKLEKPKQPIALSLEQRAAVLGILNGKDISVLEGIPGAGKTTAMRELVRQYQKAGRKVIGVTPSSSASLELAKATGIECKNASLWRKSWLQAAGREFELILRGDYYKEKSYQDTGSNSLTKNHVMIIDEASMGELANMDYLINQAKGVGAKVIFVGDTNQLSPVGWAGALGKTIGICGSERLEESRRQMNPLHQRATKLLGQYKVREALDIFWQGGNIKVSETAAAANSQCINEFVAKYIEQSHHLNKDDLVSSKTIAIGVFENKTRQLYNRKVREQLQEAGVLKGHEYSFHVGGTKGEKQFLKLSRGEQIVFSRNANHLGSNGTFNGELGTILKVSKPNKEGHGIIDILVHKASGKKERVKLDLKELAKKEWYNDGVSIEHGYAMTAHKLQGASIDHVLVTVEKGLGFEVFNVLATRHRQDVSFYTNHELLESVFYEALDETADKAKNRFTIKRDEQEIESDTILKGGLAKLVSKRTNTSFASDYRTMGQTPQDIIIKNYLDKREEAIVAIRKLSSRQQQEQRKTGSKPEMWEHKELWFEFKQAYDERAKAAKIITQGYGAYKDRLIQLNMNYATIQKHASQVKGAIKIDKVSVEQNISILHEQDIFKELIQSVSAGQTIAIARSLTEVNLHIAEISVAIEEKNTLIKEHDEQRQELVDAIRGEDHFRNVLTPEYLNRIYHTYKGSSKDAGVEALQTYQELVAKHGSEKAADMVIAKPTLLGDIRGWGLGRLLAFTSDRKDAAELCKNLGKQLKAFNASIEMERSYNEQLDQADSGAKIFVLEEKISRLRSMLPADIDREFIVKVEETLKAAPLEQSSNIDWRELQNSELFEAVRISQVSEGQNLDEELDTKEALLKVRVKKTSDLNVTAVNDNPLRQESIASTVTEIIKDGVEPSINLGGFKQQAFSQGSSDSGSKSKIENTSNHQISPLDVSNHWVTASNSVELKETVTALPEAIVNTSSQVLPSDVSNHQVTNNKSKELKQERPTLTFAEVKAGLTQSIVSEIFKQYAPHLNSDGKIQRRGNQISSGSLHMNLGNKLGLWNRFSDGSKGDIFSFIEEATGCSKLESLEIVASHAGISANVRNPKLNQHQSRSILEEQTYNNEPKNEWIAHGIVPEGANIFNAGVDLAFLGKKGTKIVETYEYKNKDNQLLGYGIRVEDKEGKKQVMPVAYCYNETLGKSQWMLKGFSDNGTKPIYGLEKLAKALEKPILIVEGEKTANAAQGLLSERTVVSWMGGAQSVDRVDWNKLGKRIVTIWPDNDAPGINAAKRITEHLNNHNGFTGLVSVVDTKALNLPEKWDLADELPKHLSKEQLANIINEASNGYNGTPNNLNREIKSQDPGTDRIVLDSISMLVEKGRLDKDEYTSKEIYCDTMVAIARTKNIDLTKSDNFVDDIRSVQDEYRKIHREYVIADSNQANKELGSLEQITKVLVRETSILHQVQLGVNKLTATHREHIESTVEQEVIKLKQFTLADKEHVGSNLYKTITGSNWLESLANKNQKQANAVKLKFTAKTIDEFLVDKSPTTKAAQEHLGLLRKYGMDEQAILKSFKTDYAKGFEHLEFYSGQLSKAEEFATKHNPIIDEAKKWGYNHDDIALTKSLVGKDDIESEKHCIGIRADQIKHYLEKHTDNFAVQKNNVKDFSTLKETVLKEQEFLRGAFERIEGNVDHYVCDYNSHNIIRSGQLASTNPELMEKALELAELMIEKEISTSALDCFKVAHHSGAILKSLEQTYELHNIYEVPKQNLEGRVTAKTQEEVFAAIEKEQDTLADLHGNIKYFTSDKELMTKCALAYEQRAKDDLAKLKSIFQTALTTGAKTESLLIKDLQQTDNLEKTYKKLDQAIEGHHISSTIEAIWEEKQAAKTSGQVINVIKKEQEFLAGLHGNLKYPKQDLNIVALAKSAYESKQEGLHDKLESVAKIALNTGAKTESSLIRYLQRPRDIKAMYKKLDHDIEAHGIKSTLTDIEREKQAAKTPDHVFDAIKKEQRFLTGLHNNLKYPDLHNESLLLSIQSAKKNEQDNVIGQLQKLSSFIQNKSFKSSATVTKILKDTTNPKETHKTLLQEYHNHYIKTVHSSLDRLKNGESFKLDNHTMSCPVKFMEYLVKTKTNEFVPHHEIKQIQSKVIQYQKHMDREYGGPSL